MKTVAHGNSQKNTAPTRRIWARRPRLRPVVWALFWTTLAHVSWLAFKFGQVRLQPDAIATAVPGFLSRLVFVPLEWAANNVVIADPSAIGLSAIIAMTICGIAHFAPRQRRISV